MELRSRRAQFINAVMHLADRPVKKLGTDRLLGGGEGAGGLGGGGGFQKSVLYQNFIPPQNNYK